MITEANIFLETYKLSEAGSREFMSKREKILKQKLDAILRDDGRGHHHAAYAERLKKFDVNIVPLAVANRDPENPFTAAISFDEGKIYISEGFLVDEDYFFQLPVLLRHELAHNLLMHQVRMINKLGDEQFNNIKNSSAIHRLWNIIMDDEISNKKYTEDDKRIIRNMYLNGRVIGGLITEEHRESWKNLSLEEMYDKVKKELAEIQRMIKNNLTVTNVGSDGKPDFIKNELLGLYIYRDTTSPSVIPGTIKSFISSGGRLDARNKWDKAYVDLASNIDKEVADKSDFNDSILTDLMKKVADSAPDEAIDLFNDGKVKLSYPEIKWAAVQVLKKFRSEYKEWYDKVISVLGEYSKEDLNDVLSCLK